MISAHQKASSVATLLVMATLVGGCERRGLDGLDKTAKNVPQPRRGGTIAIAAGADITGVNQLLDGDSRFGQDIIDQMFLRLFSEQPDFAERPPTFEGDLVQTFSWSDDGLRLSIDLRDDVMWSDGVPVSSADVAWTFEAQKSPAIAWSYGHAKERIAAIEIVDADSLIVHFSEVYASQLADLNEGAILPKHAWSQLPFDQWRRQSGWFVDHLVVNGPFTLGRWLPQQEIVLEANPGYFRAERPRLDRVVFRIIPEKINRVQQLLSGRLDFVEHLPPSEAQRVETSAQTRLLSYWNRAYSFVAWNLCNELFSDVDLRTALSLAIDRKSIVEALWGDYAKVAVSPILSSIWAFAPDLEPLPFDPGKARRVLDELGWQDRDDDGIRERDGEKLAFALSTNSDNRLRENAAIMIQHQLADIGVGVELDLMEFSTLVEKNLRHDFDATIAAWGIDTSLDLKYAFHSESMNGGYNYGCYSNPRIDELIDAVRHQDEIHDALPMLVEIQHLLHADQPYTFLWEPRKLDGISHRVQGAQPNSLSAYFNLEEWWLEPSA